MSRLALTLAGLAFICCAAPVVRAQTADLFDDPALVVRAEGAYFRQLLRVGGNPNGLFAGGDRPLHLILRQGTLDQALVLLDHGANPTTVNEAGDTPLHIAAGGDWPYPALVDRMIALGADVNAVNAAGQTPLDIALAAGAPARFTSAVVAAGGLPAADLAGWTPPAPPPPAGEGLADPAFLLGPGERAFAQLVSNGGEVNARLPFGETPLFVVLRDYQNLRASVLLRHGADPRAVNMAGETPLHVAVGFPDLDPDLVERMIEAGAVVNARDMLGQTPLDVMPVYGGAEVYDVLIAHGAVNGSPLPEPEVAEPRSRPLAPGVVLPAGEIAVSVPGHPQLEAGLRTGGILALSDDDRVAASGIALALLDCPLDIDGSERAALAGFAMAGTMLGPLATEAARSPDLDTAMQGMFDGTMAQATRMVVGSAIGCDGSTPTIIAKRILEGLGHYDQPLAERIAADGEFVTGCRERGQDEATCACILGILATEDPKIHDLDFALPVIEGFLAHHPSARAEVNARCNVRW